MGVENRDYMRGPSNYDGDNSLSDGDVEDRVSDILQKYRWLLIGAGVGLAILVVVAIVMVVLNS